MYLDVAPKEEDGVTYVADVVAATAGQRLIPDRAPTPTPRGARSAGIGA